MQPQRMARKQESLAGILPPFDVQQDESNGLLLNCARKLTAIGDHASRKLRPAGLSASKRGVE
jgi:hypothetical protein